MTAEQRLVSLQPTAKVLGVKLQSLEVSSPKPDFDSAFRTATSERVEALLIQPGPILSLHRRRVVDGVEKSRLPAMYPQNEFVEIGGLMSYGPDYADLYRRAATYVDKILKGTKPACGKADEI
jgi:putative ABC transport system substrate-binding protein